MWGHMCSNVQDMLWAMGFSHFLSLPVLKADKALMMALAERWSLSMHTFHLPMGEIGLPPIDLFMMTGLSIYGMPPPSLDDFNLELVARCIGSQPVAYDKGMKGVLPSWFKEYVWVTNESTPQAIAFSIRFFLAYMLTHFIFYGKNNKIYF